MRGRQTGSCSPSLSSRLVCSAGIDVAEHDPHHVIGRMGAVVLAVQAHDLTALDHGQRITGAGGHLQYAVHFGRVQGGHRAADRGASAALVGCLHRDPVAMHMPKHGHHLAGDIDLPVPVGIGVAGWIEYSESPHWSMSSHTGLSRATDSQDGRVVKVTCTYTGLGSVEGFVRATSRCQDAE